MRSKSRIKVHFVMAALAMILAASLGLATIPNDSVQAFNTQAIPVTDEVTPPVSEGEGRGAGWFEKALQRELKVNLNLTSLLGKADKAATRLKEAIAKGQANDWDVSDLEKELEKLTGQLVKARASHARAAELLANPAGFDKNGQVINQEVALESVKEIHQLQQEVRRLLGNTIRGALEAIRGYCQDNSIER